MNNKPTSWDNQHIANIYDFGRPIDEQTLITLFTEISTFVSKSFDKQTLLDAGCGTGRITVPIAKHFTELKIVGADISKEMLTVIADKIKFYKIKNFDLLKCSLSSIPYPNDSFDFALLSSVLHAIPDWKTALKEIIRVTKPAGNLLLLSEKNDIYEIGLERTKSKNRNMLESFWGKYIELRHTYALGSPEKSQVGIKWQLGYPETISYLEQNHFGKLLKDVTLPEEMAFTIGDFMQIVQERSWSSMFTADNEKYMRLITDLRSWLAEEEIDMSTVCTAHNIVQIQIVEVLK